MQVNGTRCGLFTVGLPRWNDSVFGLANFCQSSRASRHLNFYSTSAISSGVQPENQASSTTMPPALEVGRAAEALPKPGFWIKPGT